MRSLFSASLQMYSITPHDESVAFLFLTTRSLRSSEGQRERERERERARAMKSLTHTREALYIITLLLLLKFTNVICEHMKRETRCFSLSLLLLFPLPFLLTHELSCIRASFYQHCTCV